jgi:Flp pilus assembly protein TadG
MTALGAAIDYGRASSVRNSMQAALDATALMLPKDAEGLNAEQLGAKASAYFNALFNRPEASNVQVTRQFGSPQQGSFSLTVSGSATVNTAFAHFIGQDQIGQDQVNISATGEVVWGIKKLNLALALDNTGLMGSNNKMGELKTAAHNLFTILKNPEKTPGNIKVVNHSVRSRRQRSNRQRQRLLESTGPTGGQQRHLQQVDKCAEDEVHVHERRRHLVAESGLQSRDLGGWINYQITNCFIDFQNRRLTKQ